MGARFSEGTNTTSTNRLNQRSPPGNPPKLSGTRQGMPGYIKTGQDKSSGGLANPKAARGGPIGNIPKQGTALPARKGEPRKNWQSHTSVNGSADKSYRATSTGKAGTIRRGGMPMAPAARSSSETEGPSRGESGSKTAVSKGGALGANKLPAQGINRGKSGGHATIKGGQGSANARGPSGRPAERTARGTMESLSGKVRVSKSMGMGRRSGSKMY